MRPLLELASEGEISNRAAVNLMADKFSLTESERMELLPSGGKTRLANRVNWAKFYLIKARLVEPTKRGHFVTSDRGKTALADADAIINNKYLQQFSEFREFRPRGKQTDDEVLVASDDSGKTPDEVLREAHKRISDELASELLDRVMSASPEFFENLVVELLLAMGYGGTSEDAGQVLGMGGDGGVDGVIDQDPLGVDQIYIQAKRYAKDNTIGAGAIREFFGALNIKKAQKGIFVTTSSFSSSAKQTAKDLGTRIVLIDGLRLAGLMIKYNVGCREEETIALKKVDEVYFE